MDTDTQCNFPEMLALNLETAESVFASKRMTAGPPRLPMPTSTHTSSGGHGMGVIFESKSIQDLVEANILSTQDALAYTSARNFLSSDAFAQLQSHADAITRLTAKPALGTTPTATTTTAQQWDSDSNSIDSFELPSISLARPAAKDDAHAHGGAFSTTNRDSCISYGSFYDSYDNDNNNDNDDNDNDDGDSSVSSYGVSVPTNRGRQQSVVTAATSVSSGCRHSTQSTQSRAAMAVEHDKSEPLERHVEFALDQNVEHTPQEVASIAKPSLIPANINKSSWLSFDDGDDDDDDDDDEPFVTTSPSDLPPRPKTSTGVPDVGGMAQWTFSKRRLSRDAATPERPRTASASVAPTVSVPRRRSSLSHSARPAVQSAPVTVSSTLDEPVLLPRAVYRKPVPQPGMRASTSQFDENESDDDDDDDDTNLFGDFAGAYDYDEGEDRIMMATAVPYSRQNTLSLRSLPSRHSLLSLHDGDAHNAPLPELYPMPRHPTLAHDHADATSASLRSWIEHASRSQLALNQQYQQGAFYEEAETDVDVDVEKAADAVQTAVVAAPPRAPTPLSLSFVFHQPGLVGIPLPREVVDTLRVSVSCFPETMLSLSSFSVQTIRTYSRKVRRRSQSDADSAHRLIMSSAPSAAGTSPTPFVPPLLPPSPTDTLAGSLDLASGMARPNRASTSTSSMSTAPSTGRSFWKRLPKRLSQSRASSGLSLFHARASRDADSHSRSHSGGRCSDNQPRLSVSGRRGSRIDSLFSSSSSSALPPSRMSGRDDDLSKNSGLCLKRIFPMASDHLCESLYAHIIAFNYIGLLCPAPSPQTHAPAPAVVPKRQTIRIYVGSDVPLPASADILAVGDAVSVGRTTPIPMSMSMPMSRLENSILESPPSSPPPSRSGRFSPHGDDAHDGVYNLKPKAVMLLGLLDIFEPGNVSAAAPPDAHTPAPVHSSSLSRRYNSLRRRRLNNLSSLSGAPYRPATPRPATLKPATLKKASPSLYGDNGDDSDTDSIAQIKDSIAAATKTVAVPAAVIDAPTPSAMADAAAAAASETSRTEAPAPAPAVLTTPASAATDASMRDLHAGLYTCIGQLVATMKTANDQLSTDTDARGIDPLFLRTLCELVRSHEEQR